jgi:hypothetical protein
MALRIIETELALRSSWIRGYCRDKVVLARGANLGISMKHYLGTAWTAARLAAVVVAGTLLAGCIITSKAELVADSEGAQILPAKAYLTGYDEDGANTWKMSDDGAQEMTLNGNTYTSADGSLNARFVPIESQPGRYLLAVVSPDGSIYGAATFKNDVLALDIILGDPDPLAVAKSSGIAELQSLEAQEDDQGGIVVTTREQLNALLQLYLDEKLSLMTLVMYSSDGADGAKPARIIYQDGEYREE